MNTEMLAQDAECCTPVDASTAPSAEFIHAISEFFETDPSDLLSELGYYQREASSSRAEESAAK
ncbi:hypothetical protein CCAX7_50810 [Capsulimonas corticalis]|uniref:Uncharacterized protein n=1 Tax=Capsulimonas corticalis TaxID=2219043 RepID=A0A402CPJ4_9BACT|nr:hypothetical protein [Capsulimonas corticalis]BDI33030.1 hypothetical protein CCAX7_50810 [Capsulimonas corticalis]